MLKSRSSRVGTTPKCSIGLLQQCPDRVDDRRTVGVHLQIFGLVIMSGDMEIHHALGRQRLQKFLRIVAVIDAVDVDVVHVEQQVAVRLGQHRVDKLDFRHFLPGAA